MATILDKRDTYFVDLDGCITLHHSRTEDYSDVDEFLPGSVEKLLLLKSIGCVIILTTGRSEEQAQPALKQLKELGFEYDHCIFGLPTGTRYLVNDYKYDGVDKAIAINLKRNGGWK